MLLTSHLTLYTFGEGEEVRCKVSGEREGQMKFLTTVQNID